MFFCICYLEQNKITQIDLMNSYFSLDQSCAILTVMLPSTDKHVESFSYTVSVMRSSGSD